MSIDLLVGMEIDYYGHKEVGSDWLIQLGNSVYRVEYDEEDGWRSSCRGCERTNELPWISGKPVARVRVGAVEDLPLKYTEVTGWSLFNMATQKPVLIFGTDHRDSYYPGFVFQEFPI